MRCCVGQVLFVVAVGGFAGEAVAQHRLAIQGNNKLAIIAADGRTEMEMPWGGIHDLQHLPNGNFLVQQGSSKIAEVDLATNAVVWTYDSAKSNGNEGKRVEVHAFQPLDGNRLMIAESGPARIIEIDRAGKLLAEVKLKIDHPNPHTDTRLARKLPTGNYLVCHEGDGVVREYSPQGEVVWQYAVPLFGKEPNGGHGPEAFGNKCFSAVRLAPGNTLIGTGNGHSVLEVTPAGSIVWAVHQHDLPGITLAWVTTLEVLPNGNYVIGNCHAGPGNPLVIELEPKTKRVVWKLDRYDTFGNSVSNSLVLDVERPAAVSSETSALQPVRIGEPVGGHIHPAVCLAKSGTLVVTFGQVNHRDLRITRSTDGGRTWDSPLPYGPSVGKTYYPGSLTTLANGQILHAWNRWSGETNEQEPRHVEYSLSSDDGLTWSIPRAILRAGEATSVIRHPIIELEPDRWLLSLSGRTIIYDPRTGMSKPFGDGRLHGLVSIVRTPRGTFVSGAGLRSTDGAQTWQEIEKFPNLKEQGWRHEMVCLANGWLLVSEILGPGIGGERIRYAVSRDDGLDWDATFEYYNPGRAIGGRACPRTVQLAADAIGVVFYDIDAKQPGGPGLFFLKIPLVQLGR